MDLKISLVTLGVENVEKSVQFYRDGLGLPIQDREEGSEVAFFKRGGTRLSLYPRDSLAEDATVPAEGSGFAGVTLAHNVPIEDEVEAVLAEAADVGGRIVKRAQDTFWGGYSGYFADPDGHLLEVAAPELTDESDGPGTMGKARVARYGPRQTYQLIDV